MSEWQDFLNSIRLHKKTLSHNGCLDPYFRGHGNSEWTLQPTLSRMVSHPRYHNNKEKRLYWDFRMQGSHLLPNSATGWDVLFHMQHHGMPTRLLDWTSNLGTALYFSLLNPSNKIALWMLDPYELNKEYTGKRMVSNLNVSFKQDYPEFLGNQLKPQSALAISGDTKINRIHAQSGAFTVHGNLNTPLKQSNPNCLKKFTLSHGSFNEAREFLELAGINTYSTFPDLDGLSQYLVGREFGSEWG